MADSVWLVRKLKGIPLGEIHELLHFSDTWADHKESQEQLADDFLEAARQLGAKITFEDEK